VSDSEANGHANGKIYVKFGPRPTQEMPIEWAELMLARLAEGHGNLFGKLLSEAAFSAK
jgi:hypothetical protein